MSDEKVTYISSSKDRGLIISFPTGKKDEKTKIFKFIKEGERGLLTIDKADQDLVESHGDFGKSFARIEGSKIPKFERTNVVHGVITAKEPVSEDEKEDVLKEAAGDFVKNLSKKYERLGELKAQVLKDGELKVNAKKELVDEFNKLKDELGV